jgi:hypothetical protein
VAEWVHVENGDDWALLNRATGEVREVNNRTLIIQCASGSDSLPEATQKTSRPRRMKYKFVMSNIDTIQRDTNPRLPSGDVNENYLSINERALLYTIKGYINYDCILERDGKTMKISDIQALMGWSKPTNTKVLAELERKDYLIRIPDGKNYYVMMNPEHVYRGYSKNLSELINRYRAEKVKATYRKTLDT